MNWITALGLLAATLTTLSFLPQVVRTWRMKSAEDLSLGTFGMLCTGVACWLAYGLLIGDLPIILANAVTLVLAGSVLVLAVIYKRRASRSSSETSSPPSTVSSDSVS
ncbi:MAG: SemiSWEET transporter [Salinibacter sp.]